MAKEAVTVTSETLEAALRYLPRTIPLFGKAPPMKGWPDWPANPAAVRGWWYSHPESNVGIRTGNGLAVLDIDPRDGGDAALTRLEGMHGKLPQTVRVATGGGGWHHYFKAPAHVRSYTLAPGLEIKAAGRQVCAPPSIHPETERQYVWLDPLVESEIAELPGWLAQEHRETARVQRDHDDYLRTISASVYVPALVGAPLARDGKIACPFHSDWSPSLHCYEDPAKGWYCYQCGRGGSIYDFGSQLWDITPLPTSIACAGVWLPSSW